MHKNIWWQAFLIVIFLVICWYTGVAAYRSYNYSRLTAKTVPASIHFGVLEIADDEYLMEGKYTIQVKGQNFDGKTALKNSLYKNKWAAEQDLPKLDKLKWIVWYDPANPSRSSLQKNFPLKECISAAIMWGLFLYFLWLGFYVTKLRGN